MTQLSLSCQACGLPDAVTVGDLADHMLMIMAQDFMDPWTFNQKNLMKCCKEFLVPGGKADPVLRLQHDRISGAGACAARGHGAGTPARTRGGAALRAEAGDVLVSGGKGVKREAEGGEAVRSPESGAIKQCCARLYESEMVSQLLGESFHPGGAALTERLGQLLGLTPDSRVLDAASGKGTSAMLIAEGFGCSVIGVDLSAQNVAHANAGADRLGLAGRVSFSVGDAERLPVDDASVDAVICECAFCTFPDKQAAADGFARVLKPGGRVGLSDITRAPGPAGELADLMAWVACLADACPVDTYAARLSDAGFIHVDVENHDAVLLEMIRSIGSRLFAADILRGLQKIDLEGIDLVAAKRLTRQALAAVSERRLGYALMSAAKPERSGGQING